MRITLIILQNPYNSCSASANRWLTLIEGLANMGVKIKLLIYGGYQSEIEAKNWHDYGEIHGISYKYIAPKLITGYFKIRYNLYIGSKLRSHKLKRLLLKELNDKNEIIWTDTNLFSFQLAVKIKKQNPLQLLFLEMSEFLDIYKYNKGNILQYWKAFRTQKFFEKKAFKKYDAIALMTKTLLSHYLSFPLPHPNFLHLPMTVDLERFNSDHIPMKEFVKPYIAFVGVMNDAKDGVNILINAFAEIHDQFPDHKVYLIGAWNYDTQNHLKMINELGLADLVFWMKEYPRDNIPSIIKNADLLVLPRPNSKQAQGGFPTKLGEYLATGNPVCATTVGEIPDYLKDNESIYFAKPGSTDSFADAMQRALANKNEAKQIGINGRKVAETHFNKDNQAKMLYEFLLSLTNDGSKQQKTSVSL